MNQQETASEWLARKKGNHRVPSSTSLDRIVDRAGSSSMAGNMAGDQEKVTNEILYT